MTQDRKEEKKYPHPWPDQDPVLKPKPGPIQFLSDLVPGPEQFEHTVSQEVRGRGHVAAGFRLGGRGSGRP